MIALGPRGKRRFPAGAADEDVKNILETLEREPQNFIRKMLYTAEKMEYTISVL